MPYPSTESPHPPQPRRACTKQTRWPNASLLRKLISSFFEPFIGLDACGTLSAKHAGTIDKSSATSIFIDVDDSTTSSQWSTTIRTTLQYARHTITATIVNALHTPSTLSPICDQHSRQERRRTRMVACQQVSDAFDGTISTAVATWALDSGTVSCVVM